MDPRTLRLPFDSLNTDRTVLVDADLIRPATAFQGEPLTILAGFFVAGAIRPETNWESITQVGCEIYRAGRQSTGDALCQSLVPIASVNIALTQDDWDGTADPPEEGDPAPAEPTNAHVAFEFTGLQTANLLVGGKSHENFFVVCFADDGTSKISLGCGLMVVYESGYAGSTVQPVVKSVTVDNAGFICIDDNKTVRFRVRQLEDGTYTLEPYSVS